MFADVERLVGPHAELLADRLRATVMRLRGATWGPKGRIGAHCQVQRPWCMSVGHRSHFEHEAFVKVAEESARIQIGNEVFVGRGVELDISTELTIGNFVLVAPGCFITDHWHRHAPHATIASQGCDSAPVHIADDVWIGVNAVILAGVSIGRGAIVGAGAVVNCNVESGTIVAGVPARAVGRR